MDIEKFRNLWWSTPQSTPSLEQEGWIERSVLDSTSFWSSLLLLQNQLSSTPIKSVQGSHYHFYYDAILRHAKASPAVIFIDGPDTLITWSYSKLHFLVNFQLKEWNKHALMAGQLAVIDLPVGPHYFVALLTALRLGLKICYLPSSTPYLGKKHHSDLLQQIKPDIVITQEKGSQELYKTVYIDDLQEEKQEIEPASFAYESGQVLQISLALTRKEPFSLVPLDAHTTYFHALRDGLITLNLKPGMTHSTPMASPLLYQPCSTLMTLLSGATIFHVSDEALEKDPLLIKNEKIHIIAISAALQRLWSYYPGAPAKNIKGYYLTPFAQHSLPWHQLTQLNKLEETPAFHLLIDNSVGGSVLFSKPTTKGLDRYLKPALGVPWFLKELNGSTEPSLRGFGLLTLNTSSKENNDIENNFILTQIGKNCLISSTQAPSREGITIPIKKIEDCVTELSFADHCFLYSLPKMGEAATYLLILLVFVDPFIEEVSETLKEEWTAQLSQALTANIGSIFLPDRIEYYPLVPQMKNKSLDRIWCESQYTRGLLLKKKKSPLFQSLSRLKKTLLR